MFTPNTSYIHSLLQIISIQGLLPNQNLYSYGYIRRLIALLDCDLLTLVPNLLLLWILGLIGSNPHKLSCTRWFKLSFFLIFWNKICCFALLLLWVTQWPQCGGYTPPVFTANSIWNKSDAHETQEKISRCCKQIRKVKYSLHMLHYVKYCSNKANI